MWAWSHSIYITQFHANERGFWKFGGNFKLKMVENQILLCNYNEAKNGKPCCCNCYCGMLRCGACINEQLCGACINEQLCGACINEQWSIFSIFVLLAYFVECSTVWHGCSSFPLFDCRENEQLSKYGDTKSARSIMLIELKKLIEANPLFREKLVFPTLKASRLRTLINQRYNIWYLHSL